MKRHCIHQRLIALILTVLVLGVQFVNALSDSHSLIAHRHAGGSGYVSQAHGAHDHQQTTMKGGGSRTHVHASEHDPGDHSHDLPLRMALAVLQFSFMPIWHTEAALPFRSIIVHPLERPPKSSVLASFA